MSKSKKEEKRPQLTQKKKCSCCSNELDKIVQTNCEKKNNYLQKCEKCEIKNPKWPVITAPDDFQFLNTGWDGNNGILLGGFQDLQWEIGLGGDASGPSSVSLWKPSNTIKTIPGNFQENFDDARWISEKDDGNSVMDEGTLVNKHLYFRIRFYLDYPIAPLDFSPTLNLWADNTIQDIYVNGIKQSTFFSSLPQNTIYGFKGGNEIKIQLNKNWKKCKNELVIQVQDNGSKTGLLIHGIDYCKQIKNIIKPELEIKWGNKKQECLSPSACEIMCVTVCNPYSNVIMTDFKICQLEIYDEKGNMIDPIAGKEGNLNIIPNSVLCYGDIKSCSCVSREIAIHSKRARRGKYRIKATGICYGIKYCIEECFELLVCGKS